MNWSVIGFGSAMALVGLLLLVLVRVKRKHLSGLRAFRGYFLFGLLFLFGTYMTAVGAGIAMSPRELREAWDDFRIREANKGPKEYRDPAEEMTDEVAKKIIKELRSDNVYHLDRAFGDLQRFPPENVSEPVRNDVERALLALLDHRRIERQITAAKTLETWGSVNSVPRLIDVSTSQRDWRVRRAAIHLLGTFPDARAVEPLGKLVTSDVGDVARATLKKIGPPAEPLAQSFLEHDNPHWHEIGCELLVDVGTSASLEKLDALQAEGTPPQLRNAAAAAAEAIRKREAENSNRHQI